MEDEFVQSEKIKGVHDVFFVFKGGNGNLFNFDWWRFLK
jgi:Carbohydrate binding module (family 6).